jgi:hypothetical protein
VLAALGVVVGGAAVRGVPVQAQDVPQAPPVGPPPDDTGLPPQVPLRATGAARPADVRVIEAWLAAARAGDMQRAARSWRLPAFFQDGGPVVTASVPGERLAVVSSFRCGAWLQDAGGAGAYVVAALRLVPRPGATCGRAAGHLDRAAIRVVYGRIGEYYRLPPDPAQKPRRQVPHPAPGSGPFAPSA